MAKTTKKATTKKTAATKGKSKKPAAGKKSAKTKEKKVRKVKYWLCRNMDDDDQSMRTKKRGDAFDQWKADKQVWAKPVKVEVEFENPIDLVQRCMTGKVEEIEDGLVDE